VINQKIVLSVDVSVSTLSAAFSAVALLYYVY